ncbi:MAG TPA: FAD-dependent oxidoreductase [Coriobacteriia bacterium]
MAGGHEVAYLDRDECGSDIVTVRFEKPEGYSFTPGQWFTLRLETDAGPATETFSHSSAPSDPFIELTTRASGSPFKRALVALEPGQRVHVNGPGGRLSVGDEVQRVAFLAGGVGITPVRSILRDARVRGRRFADALLLYGNRDDSCVPFLGEFEEMAEIGLRVVVVYEQPPTGWTGEAGFITAETVRRHLDVTDGRPFVVTGPPVMVTAMERVLDELEIPAERRRVESFSSPT